MVLMNTCDSHWPLILGPKETNTTNKWDNKSACSRSSDTRLQETVTSLDIILIFQYTFLKGKVTAMNKSDKRSAADSPLPIKGMLQSHKATKYQYENC